MSDTAGIRLGSGAPYDPTDAILTGVVSVPHAERAVSLRAFLDKAIGAARKAFNRTAPSTRRTGSKGISAIPRMLSLTGSQTQQAHPGTPPILDCAGTAAT